MSYEVEFGRYVVTVPNAPGRNEPRRYLGIAQRGSSNLLEENGRIARDHATVAFAEPVEFINEVTRAAMFCEGGELRCNGHRTTPEGYIKAWRKALTQAVPIESYLHYGGLRLTVRPSALELLQEQLDAGRTRSAHRLKRYVELMDRLRSTEGIAESSHHDPIYQRQSTATEFQLSLTNRRRLLEAIQELIDLGPTRLRFTCSGFDTVAWSLARSRENAAASMASVA